MVGWTPESVINKNYEKKNCRRKLENELDKR